MKILVITPDVPWPCIGGARTRNAHLIRALADNHDVRIIALAWDEMVGVPPTGMSMRTVPWRMPEAHAAVERGEPGAWDRLSAPDAEPYGISYFDVPAMCQAIEETCARQRPDVAVFAETATARFRTALPRLVPFVLDLHDVQARKQARYDVADAKRIQRFEAEAVRSAAAICCVSDAEASAARHLLAATRVHVIPNGVDTRQFPITGGPGADDDLVFTGSLYTRENVEALAWFVAEVLPLIRARRPWVVLHVVGARPGDAVRRLASESVRLHADVPDVVPYLHAAGVAVVPLQHGGGTRLKILEAASAGRPIVTTTVGVEGLPMKDGRDIDIADHPDDFANAVLRLCANPDLRIRRASAARHIAEEFDWSIIGARWCEVVESAT